MNAPARERFEECDETRMAGTNGSMPGLSGAPGRITARLRALLFLV